MIISREILLFIESILFKRTDHHASGFLYPFLFLHFIFAKACLFAKKTAPSVFSEEAVYYDKFLTGLRAVPSALGVLCAQQLRKTGNAGKE